MDIAARLRALEQRKQQRERLLEDVRKGLYADIIPASELPEVPAVAAPGRGVENVVLRLGDGVVLKGERGIVWQRELAIQPGDHEARYGLAVRLEDALEGRLLRVESLAAIAPEVAEEHARSPLSPTDIGFLDIETSGLGSSAGTLPFLVTIGWWENDPRDGWRFVLKQWMVDDFCHEGELLARVLASAARFRVLCHYNGRSFDVPVLRSRCVLHRERPTALAKAQLDLFPPSRRLWRRVLSSCSLKSVERLVLLHDRGPDVAGSLMPEIFFAFARTGNPEGMVEAVHHNAQDVASLAGLLVHLGEAWHAPHSGRLTHGEEFAAMAKWHERQGNLAQARGLLDEAIRRTPEPDREAPLLLRRAAAARREDRLDDAEETWRFLSRREDGHGVAAVIELAKLLEHKRRDPAGALAVIEERLARERMRSEIASFRGTAAEPSPLGRLLPALEKRAGRLRRKAQQP